MAINSRNKGKVGEREAAALLKQYGFEARRGQQFAGGPDSADVKHSLTGMHLEVKRTEALNVYKAMDQAVRDAGPREEPVVLHRKNNREWLVVLRADDFLKLCRDYIYAPAGGSDEQPSG